jgi:hypothetical protein
VCVDQKLQPISTDLDSSCNSFSFGFSGRVFCFWDYVKDFGSLTVEQQLSCCDILKMFFSGEAKISNCQRPEHNMLAGHQAVRNVL